LYFSKVADAALQQAPLIWQQSHSTSANYLKSRRFLFPVKEPCGILLLTNHPVQEWLCFSRKVSTRNQLRRFHGDFRA